MKKYILTLGLVFGLVGCSDDYYESINTDQANPTDVPAEALFTSASISLGHQMINQNVNLNVFRFFTQYLTTTTYTDEPNYDLDTRNIPGNHWNRLYVRVLQNLKDAKEKVVANEDATLPAAQKANQLAIIDVMEVYTWQILVDTFGNVPYTEALQGLENLFPKYDDSAFIYGDLMDRITNDINQMDVSFPGFNTGDIFYDGDVNMWKKMAASLKLRLAVQIMDVDPNASNYVQQALTAGVFNSNNDNFKIIYKEAAPYTNPVYEDLVLSGRTDYVPANTVVDYMKGLDDPRMPIYFSKLIDGEYVGGDYGTSNNYETHSHEGDIFFTPTMPGVLLDYAEVEFLQAEYYMKTGDATAAKAHYEAGILASMDFWGVDSADAAAYVAANAWDGTDKNQLALQFWIGMYNRGWEGWNVWRRLDSPVMNEAIDSGEPVPTRYTYPLSESSLNPEAYGQAVSAMGGDTKTTKVFWDIH